MVLMWHSHDDNGPNSKNGPKESANSFQFSTHSNNSHINFSLADFNIFKTAQY
jgi:hypothetical protein